MASKRYTEEEFKNAVKELKSYAGVCKLLGLSPKGGNIATIKRKIELLSLDSSHFTGKAWNKGDNSINDPRIYSKDISEILKENSGWSTHAIRLKLLKCNIKDHKCEVCGITEWNGLPVPLELHHLNGIRNDHRLENLQMICPNCHAQTDNYSGKSK